MAQVKFRFLNAQFVHVFGESGFHLFVDDAREVAFTQVEFFGYIVEREIGVEEILFVDESIRTVLAAGNIVIPSNKV